MVGRFDGGLSPFETTIYNVQPAPPYAAQSLSTCCCLCIETCLVAMQNLSGKSMT